MSIYKKALLIGLSAIIMQTSTVSGMNSHYMTEEEYSEALQGTIYEDRGIVVENNPMLGYMVYRNATGQHITAHYYNNELTVEKAPYYEQEDKIGYMDELFPYFSYDPKDTTIEHIAAGDNIYLRMNKEGYITYISAFNDYTVRYGKVYTWTTGAQAFETLVLEEADGTLYHYPISQYTAISKGGKPYSLGQLREGEWVKVLVSQKIMGEGIIEESVKEISVDPDTRTIENVYRGELINVNAYKNEIILSDYQILQNSGFGSYESLKQFIIDPRNIKAYFMGNSIGLTQMQYQMIGSNNYAYVATENYMGREQAIKINFQSTRQRTLEPTTVTYASPGVVRLLTGETIMISDDSIVVRDDRLVGPGSVIVGDTLQAVVTGDNKLAVGRILENIGTGKIEIFRGRIKEVEESHTFEVETFSMFQDAEWYFHPSPRTFQIGKDTKLYGAAGIELEGMETFLTHGQYSKENMVYTVIAEGDEALRIVDMPYTKEAIKGYVYETEEGILVKDLYTYNATRDRWEDVSNINITAVVDTQPNTVIIKDGELVSEEAIEKGDMLTVMMENEAPITANMQHAQIAATGYVIIVE